MAGAGALLALKGVLRKVIGALLTATGLGCVAAAAAGLAGGADPFWPALAIVGGLVVAATGALTVKAAGSWPSMGARYERPVHQQVPKKSESKADLWDALDRGEDPTS